VVNCAAGDVRDFFRDRDVEYLDLHWEEFKVRSVITH